MGQRGNIDDAGNPSLNGPPVATLSAAGITPYVPTVCAAPLPLLQLQASLFAAE